jgi:RimJ/RimL family protein N-acetyltransferase
LIASAPEDATDRIVTARLVLRRARPGDLAAIHDVMRRPEAMRYWSTPPHRSLDETRDWLTSMIEAPAAQSDDFVIEHEGRVVGKAGCWRLPEIGFILHPDCWGRGLAREALEAVIARLFARFPIDAVTADVDPGNLASLALLKRLGFEETGRAARTWQVGDEWCDSIYLALRRPEADWEARRGLRAPDHRR